MKNKKYIFKLSTFVIISLFLFIQCSDDDDNTNYVRPTIEVSTHSNDLYLNSQMFDPLGTAVRWRWNDNFIKSSQEATPIIDTLVIPVTKLIEYLWIEPYQSLGENGRKMIEELFPTELIYLGSYIYNSDGTQLLGFAEGGVRITLLNLNAYDLSNRNWITSSNGGVIATAQHEFTHIVHQHYTIPTEFNTISSTYKGGGWHLISESDALKLGMVSTYGTKNEYEDFAEIVSTYLAMRDSDFKEEFITLEEDCEDYNTSTGVQNCIEKNEGRKLIKQKLELITEYYQSNFDIDLGTLRDTMENRINYVVTNNIIP